MDFQLNFIFMIQVGSILKVIDNSGANKVRCLRIISASQPRYAFLGDMLLVSVKRLRAKRRAKSKVKKGALTWALIVHSKTNKGYYFGDNLVFYDNSVVLLNNKGKLIGTRIFGLLPKCFRYTQYMRLVTVCTGVRL